MNEEQLKHQAIMIRDIIDLYREYESDDSLIESLDGICFAMARMIDDTDFETRKLPWQDLYSFFDQKYWTMQHGGNAPDNKNIDKLYRQTQLIIGPKAE